MDVDELQRIAQSFCRDEQEEFEGIESAFLSGTTAVRCMIADNDKNKIKQVYLKH